MGEVPELPGPVLQVRKHYGVQGTVSTRFGGQMRTIPGARDKVLRPGLFVLNPDGSIVGHWSENARLSFL